MSQENILCRASVQLEESPEPLQPALFELEQNDGTVPIPPLNDQPLQFFTLRCNGRQVCDIFPHYTTENSVWKLYHEANLRCVDHQRTIEGMAAQNVRASERIAMLEKDVETLEDMVERLHNDIVLYEETFKATSSQLEAQKKCTQALARHLQAQRKKGKKETPK